MSVTGMRKIILIQNSRCSAIIDLNGQWGVNIGRLYSHFCNLRRLFRLEQIKISPDSIKSAYKKDLR